MLIQIATSARYAISGKTEREQPYHLLTLLSRQCHIAAMNTTPSALILSRKAQIEDEIGSLAARINDLRKELDDLTVAQRVMSKLYGMEAMADDIAELPIADSNSLSKPSGIPTMPEMITAAIQSERDANGNLLSLGLEPRDITKFIAENWWPDVRSELVGPIAWRMWRQGRLSKLGSRYCLPKQIDPAQSKSSPTAEQGHHSEPVEAGLGGGT